MARSAAAADWRDDPIAVYSDPIFFSKYNVKVGSKFIYYGRRAHGERYICEEIWTFKPGPRGTTRHYVTEVQKLNDIVVLRSDRGSRRDLAFGYISYSAIWRLDK